MSLDYLILPEAREDIDDAYAWYEAQTVGRGDEFLTELYTVIGTLRSTPELYGYAFDALRAAPLPASKYIVYYTVEADRVELVGVKHAAADLRKWLRRQ